MNFPREESLRVHPGAKSIIRNIELNGKNCENIIGLFFMGSFARGDSSYYSDIDLVSIIADEYDEESALNELNQGMDFKKLIRKGSKEVLYFEHEKQKVELTILKKRELGTVEKLFKGSRIVSLDNAIIFDKTGALRSKLEEWIVPPNQEPSEFEVNEEARSFLYYYESMNVPLSRGDTYRAYFLYSLMYFKLAAILYAHLGKGDFLYEPAFLINSLTDSDVQLSKKFKKLIPTLSLSDLIEKKEEALNLFIEVYGKMPSVGREIVEMATFLRDFIKNKYPNLWKLKDLCYENLIKPSCIYRSARLTIYKPEVIKQWISKLNLKTIVDLRGDEEVEIDPYDQDTLSSVSYIRSPIIGWIGTEGISDEQSSRGSVDTKLIMYDTATKNESLKNAIKVVLTLLSDRKRLPLLYHCKNGSDRTGILSAEIEGLAGVPNEVIINNYLASSTLLKSEYIIAFMKRVEEIGGYRNFAEKTGITSDVIEMAKRNIAGTDLNKWY